MGKKENKITDKIHIRLSRVFQSCLFRINTGRAWTGNKIIKLGRDHPIWPNSIVIRDPRPFKTGTPNGYPDLSGWTPVVITLEMVGQTKAIFTSIEVKTPENNRVTDDQANFDCQVKKSGGISGVARSEEEAEKIVSDSI